jgi:hypothetical protein
VQKTITAILASALAQPDPCDADCALGKARAYFTSCVATIDQILRTAAQTDQSRVSSFTKDDIFAGLVRAYMGPNRRRDDHADRYTPRPSIVVRN